MKSSILSSILCVFASAQQISAAAVQARQATTTSSATAGIATPPAGWTQADVAANCNRWDLIAAGNTCQTFVDRYPEITLALLYQWNPSTGPTCNNLWADYYICTSVQGFGSTSVATPVSTSAVTSAPSGIVSSSTTSSVAVGTPAPGPTQPGAAANCNRWDLVPVGASCQTFLSRYPEITIALLIEWNPAIGDTCFIWANYYLCTSVEGFAGTTSITTPTSSIPTSAITSAVATTTTTSVGVPAPGPTQAGVAANCTRWDLVTSGATCQAYIDKYTGVTLELLYEWNPAIGSGCTNLWLDYYVCTAVTA